jgi:hypothetical protein
MRQLKTNYIKGTTSDISSHAMRQIQQNENPIISNPKSDKNNAKHLK